MKRLIWLAPAAIALVCTGIAVAHAGGARSVKNVAATFSATTVSNLRTGSCTGADGSTYTLTRGTYAGTATGDPTLTGPVTLDVTSYVNATTGYGTASGRLRIDTASNGHTDAHFNAVVSHGAFAGFAQGRVRGIASLEGNVSATYATATGLTDGKIGGSSGGDAVELSFMRCANGQTPKPEHIKAVGNATAVSATSISAAGVTCAVPSDLSQFVTDHVQVGTRVELECSVSNGVGTLTRIEVKHHSASSHTRRR